MMVLVRRQSLRTPVCAPRAAGILCALSLIWILAWSSGVAFAQQSAPSSVAQPSLDSWDPNVVQPPEQFLISTFEENGRLIDEVVVPGLPPKDFRAPVVAVPESNSALGIKVLSNVPAFNWCYGCSATSAAMMMGYYDNNGRPNMYAGPTNGGVCPMTNSSWGSGESPLSATHMGYDGRLIRGHVDDYWWGSGNCDPDRYIGNWTEHTQGDCTGDYMGTNQSKVGVCDGATTFYYYNDGSALCDYTGDEPNKRDGCHGLRLFAQSRGYSVNSNCSQYIYGHNGNTQGFTFADFQSEIDAGRPVLIHMTGHTVLGYGYNTTGNIIYIHDTWDWYEHQMTWGGTYSGLQHYGATTLQMFSSLPPPPTDEDFETGSLNKWPWQAGGNVNWTVTSGSPHTGSYSAKAGTISHSQSCYLQVTMTRDAGNVSFYRKVSCESSYDKVRFLVDNVEKANWSGEVDWNTSALSYAVTAGTHTYKWEYSKDGSVNSGSDTAWIDDIAFPPAKYAAISIPAAKLLADSSSVALESKSVTAVIGGSLYVQEQDTWSGILVNCASIPTGVAAGALVDVGGVMSTNADGERCIEGTVTHKAGTGVARPAAMSNRSLGGGDWNYSPGTGAGQKGIEQGVGLNNIGLLVTTWGRVTSDSSGVIASWDMSTNPGWTLQGQWAYGVPTGGGSSLHDPTAGYTGAYVVGYNLAGDYPSSMTSALFATTPAVNCSNHSGVRLQFRRWLGVESASYDHANVEVSSNGVNWISVWNHTSGSFCDGAWLLQDYDISSTADRQPAVYVRWGMGTTDDSITYPGWNIDDVVISGEGGALTIIDGSGAEVQLVDFPTGLSTPSGGLYISVTGISACYKDTEGKMRKCLRVLSWREYSP